MSTHNIPFSIYKKENQHKLSQIFSYGILFQWTQGGVRNSHGERAISVQAIEFLLYAVEYSDLLLFLLLLSLTLVHPITKDRSVKAEVAKGSK